MNEDDLLQRAAEERANIVNKYARGREEGAQIDPWEDPSFEIYHVTDRYGFIHDQRVPQRKDTREVQLERERAKKWLKMRKEWEQRKLSADKLRRRVYKGIPESLRGTFWSLLLEIDTLKKEQEGVYEDMRAKAWKWSPDIRQIDLDVNRTYRDHIMFRERYGLKQQALFNILSAYSVYNREIGYCQGMSQIAALLLMYLNEEDAFWALSVLVCDKKYSMHGFFIQGFPKLVRFQEHHEKIMNKFLPKLKKHLDRNGVDTGLYTLKWFFQCFLDRVPFRLALRIWDVYLLDGERVLIAMAYNLLKLNRRQLMRLGMDDILQYLQIRMERSEMEDDVVIESLQRCMEELKKAKLDYPGPPPPDELPKTPFGTFTEPTFEQKVGRRTSELTALEKVATESVVLRRQQTEEQLEMDQLSPRPPGATSNGHHRLSHISGSDGGNLGDQGSKFSYDPSIDDASSLVSRRSLADTSVTSTADLSVFSSVTRSHAQDNSLDTHSNVSDDSGPRAITPTATPRALTPQPSAPSPDVVRIYVPYTSPQPPSPCRQNGDLPPRSLPCPLTSDQNKIRIKVDNNSQEEQTPIVEHGLIKPFQLNSPEIDLK